MKSWSKLIILSVAAVLIVGTILVLETKKNSQSFLAVDQPVKTSQPAAGKDRRYETAKEIVSPAGFINDEPFKIQDLIGKKVILVDFWTYSCINCQRTLPYLTSWYDKYQDQGLEIIGIHTPEFEFEKKLANVERAVEQYGIKYPVVLDNDYGTWRNYANRYWPHKYLIDIDGFIVYDHIGEGGYAETEQEIQKLLAERQQVLGEGGSIASDMVNPTGVEQVDTSRLYSPEIYFGSARNTNLGNGQSGQTGSQNFILPNNIRRDNLYLAGSWNIQPEFAENQQAGAKIVFYYQAQKVFIVARSDQPVKLQILRDGQPVGEVSGRDVINGEVTVQADQLYRLIEDSEWGEHTLEIIVESPGLQVFTFTFG